MIQKYLRQGTKVWVHHSGRTFTIDTSQGNSSGKNSRDKNNDSLASGKIESPMPGKILKFK